MKKLIFGLVVLMVMAVPCFADYLTFEADDGRAVPVSNAYPLPIVSTQTISVGTLTINVPVYSNPAGTAVASSPLDTLGRVIVNIGSESIGLLTLLKSISSAIGSDTLGLKVSMATFTTPLPSGVNAIGFIGANAISTFSTAITLSVGTSAAVIVSALGGTARVMHVCSDQDVNFGGSDTPTGTGSVYVPGGAPDFTFNIATGTTGIYFRGRTASASVRIFSGVQ